jgi:copper resistance protein B
MSARLLIALSVTLVTGIAYAQDVAPHVPPDPPTRTMPPMSNEHMIEMMQMDDTHPFGMLLLDQLEWRSHDGSSSTKDGAFAWDGSAWYGGDYHKLWFKTEGERDDDTYATSSELLWDRIFSKWWHVQAGARVDLSDAAPTRTWAAIGVQGLAPYWFEVEITGYVGDEGRTALRATVEYELLITQRLVLQPKLEVNAYGKDDLANGVGSGLSTTELGLRLRYEIRRELAPYIGVTWRRAFGHTADLVDDASDLALVAGLRVWF